MLEILNLVKKKQEEFQDLERKAGIPKAFGKNDKTNKEILWILIIYTVVRFVIEQKQKPNI